MLRTRTEKSTWVGACLLGIALSATTVSAANDVSEDARKHFTAGVNLLRDPQKPRYEEAYREFKTAYRLSQSAKVLGNLGLCAMMLERDAEAIDAYTKYLASDVPIDGEQRAQIERDLSTLKTGLVTVTVSTRPTGAVLVDVRVPSHGDAVTNVYPAVNGEMTIGLRQGHHVMRARLPGRPEAVWEIEATAGEPQAHVFEIPEAAPPEPVRLEAAPVAWERPIPTTTLATGGAALAFGVACVITGAVALDAKSTFQTRNNGFDPEGAESARSRAQTWNVVSDVTLGLAVVSAAASTYFYLTRPSVARRGSVSPFLVTF